MKLVDDRPAPGSEALGYREAWSFKGSRTRDLIRSKVEDCPGPILHSCSGSSSIGDIKLDLSAPSADVKADARALPVSDVGTILMDPPWGLPLDQRLVFIIEALRAIKVGGVLLLYGPWMPAFSEIRLEEAWVRVNGSLGMPGNAVLLTKWRKTGKIDTDPEENPFLNEKLPDGQQRLAEVKT